MAVSFIGGGNWRTRRKPPTKITGVTVIDFYNLVHMYVNTCSYCTWKHDWDQPELFLNKGIKTVYLFMKLHVSVKTINNIRLLKSLSIMRIEESINMTRVLVFLTSKHLGHSLSIQGAGNVSTWITQFITLICPYLEVRERKEYFVFYKSLKLPKRNIEHILQQWIKTEGFSAAPRYRSRASLNYKCSPRNENLHLLVQIKILNLFLYSSK